MFFFYFSDLDKLVQKETNRILEHLLGKYPKTSFILRRTDMNLMLEKSFWFYGEEGTIAISFWTGMDWVKKIPNIALLFDLDKNVSRLIFTTTDDYDKHQGIVKYFVNDLNLQRHGEFTYALELGDSENTVERLDYFIKEIKPIIDGIISKNYVATEIGLKNAIGLINWKYFQEDLNNVKKYQNRHKIGSLPITLNTIDIFKYGILKDIHIENLPSNNQWIFITGENGTGKTTFLKALTYSLCNGPDVIARDEKHRYDFDTGVTLDKYGKKPRFRVKVYGVKQTKINSVGFVAFGPTRLNVKKQIFSKAGSETEHDFTSNLYNPYKSLFDSISPLMDLGFIMRVREKGELKGLENFDEKLRFIVEALMQICDDIVDIHVGIRTEYFELVKGKEGVEPRIFEDLSSGYKNLISMVTHLMVQLYIQQPRTNDPAQLVGIVLIDEIELHAHPKMQVEIIEKLSKIFPRIQFVVSTHSPIPLLGRKENTVVLRTVKSEKGIEVQRLTKLEKELKYLTPNTIFTSDIFDFDLFNRYSDLDFEKLVLEDDYKDIELNKKIDDRLKNLDSKIFPENLFEKDFE